MKTETEYERIKRKEFNWRMIILYQKENLYQNLSFDLKRFLDVLAEKHNLSLQKFKKKSTQKNENRD